MKLRHASAPMGRGRRLLPPAQQLLGHVGICRESCDGQIETLIMRRMLLLANYVAVSEDFEDRAFAPTYLERVGNRLRTYLDARSG